MAKNKTPRISQNPYKGAGKAANASVVAATEKRARVADEIAEDGADCVRVRLHRADQGGEWSILDITREDHQRLLDLIRRLEKTDAKQAFTDQNNCKRYDMSDCPNKDTLKRLADEYEGLDALVRFRLDGTTRVYGARERHEFHLIWWDSEHEVWPSSLRNT